MNIQHNSRLHILIVEDNRTQAEFLKYILEKKGFQVSVSGNGCEALDQIKKEKPSIVLTDVMMPEMDGYELCSIIKGDSNTSDIPVILVTYLNNPANVIRGLEAGADNFIIKPFEPDSIYFHIHNTIRLGEKLPSQNVGELLEVQFLNEPHRIFSTRAQILNILLSTYDTAVKNNSELQVAHERLQYMNAQMQKVVDDLQHTNEKLTNENLERSRVERALTRANDKIHHIMAITCDLLQEKIRDAYSDINLALKDQETGGNGSWKKIRDGQDILTSSLDIIARINEIRDIGMGEPVWQNIRTIIDNYPEISEITIKNEIPECIEIFADPLLEKVLIHLDRYLIVRGLNGYTLRFFTVSPSKMPTIGIIAKVAETDRFIKDSLKSSVSEENWEIYASREILSVTGITLHETDLPGEGIFFEIIIPEEMIRGI